MERLKILMVEYHSWDSPIQIGGHKYGAGFIKDGHEVLWIASFWHALSGQSKIAPRPMEERKAYIRGQSKVFKNGPEQYSPFTLLPVRKMPVLGSPAAFNNMLRATVPSFGRWLKNHGWSNPDVLWITTPFMTRVLDYVKPRILVHRMADDLASFGNVPQPVIDAEEELVQRSDVILVTSRELVEKVRAKGKEPIYLPNGADTAFFSRRDFPEPEDLSILPHPRVVYVGAIDHWFDFEMLTEAAKNNPDISFILIGPNAAGWSRPDGVPNIHLMGPRPFKTIPAYLTHCDAAIIPFKKNKLTDNINPIKLYEYMAAGRPVVMTDLAESKNMNPPAYFASSVEEFSESLRKAIDGGTDRPEFLQFARENSWDNRYNKMITEMAERLKQRL